MHLKERHLKFCVLHCSGGLRTSNLLFTYENKSCKNAMISAVDCPDCGLQVPLRTAGPEGMVELPPNLYLDSLLTALQQDITCGAEDQRCSRCQTVGSASSCQHCRQVGIEHSVTKQQKKVTQSFCIFLYPPLLCCFKSVC
jgi:hypothetical protein